MKKYVVGIVILIILTFIITIFLARKKTSTSELEIGAILPLTGPAANHGQDAKDGINLAINDINVKGGILNSKIKVIFEDSRSTTEGCVSGIQKLIQVDRVPVILGPISSSDVLAVAPIVGKNKTVLFTPSASSAEISQVGDYVFRNSVLAEPQGQRMADFCFNRLKQTASAILYINDDTGRAYFESFKDAFEALGGKIVLIESYNRDDTDFRTHIAKIKSAGANSVYIPAIPQTMGNIIKQSAELGYKPFFLGNIGIEGEDLLTITKGIGKKVFYTSVMVDEKFSKKFEEYYGRIPLIAASLAYDAAGIVGIAIAKAGSGSADEIKKAIYEITNYSGVTGFIRFFDRNGDAQREIIIKTIEEDKFVQAK